MKQLSTKNIDVLSQGVVLIDFYADWCGPCKMISPLLQQLETMFPDVTFLKLNVENEPNISSQYNVVSVPTLILLRNGEEISRKIGFLPKQMIENWIRNI